jgi:L-threonylcarbamoyladenylate synthase
METLLLPTFDPISFDQALETLRRGELVAFPTDTVYGVGVLAFDEQAIEQLYIAKIRDPAKAIAVLIGSPAALAQVAGEMGPLAQRLAQRFWPGPLTLVVPRHPGLPGNLSPQATIGVRMPDHPAALTLLNRAGPLAVTSANLSGAASTQTAQEVYEQLQGRIPLILDGGRTPGGLPSTVVDCTGSQPRILREGPISLQDLLAA